MAGWTHKPGMSYDATGLVSEGPERNFDVDVQMVEDIRERIANGLEAESGAYSDEDYEPHPCKHRDCGHLAAYYTEFCPVHARKGTYT